MAAVAFPGCEEELVAALNCAYRCGAKMTVIGNGSNLIASDKGYNGIIIATEKLNKIKTAGNRIWCESGVSMTGLALQARDAALTGAEFLYGIPGTVGGGLYMNGGTVERCRFLSNYTLSHQGGGGAYVAGGVLRNCLFLDNSARRNVAGSEGDGGGALLTGTGRILSSTFVRNWAIKDGGGIQMLGGGLTNSIVYGNWVTTVGSHNLHGLGGTIRYTCSPDLPEDPVGTGNRASDPRFEDAAQDNYRLLPTSPSHRTGVTEAWMTGATDLEGKPRLVGGRTDMGCYQTPETRGFVLTVR